jgi:DNA-directed RNA polymerase specialized sigma24 family protein
VASRILGTHNSNLPIKTNGSAARSSSDKGGFQKIILHIFEMRPVYRDALLLCDIQGFTIAEAAAILDICAARLTARLDSARRRLNTKFA